MFYVLGGVFCLRFVFSFQLPVSCHFIACSICCLPFPFFCSALPFSVCCFVLISVLCSVSCSCFCILVMVSVLCLMFLISVSVSVSVHVQLFEFCFRFCDSSCMLSNLCYVFSFMIMAMIYVSVCLLSVVEFIVCCLFPVLLHDFRSVCCHALCVFLLVLMGSVWCFMWGFLFYVACFSWFSVCLFILSDTDLFIVLIMTYVWCFCVFCSCFLICCCLGFVFLNVFSNMFFPLWCMSLSWLPFTEQERVGCVRDGSFFTICLEIWGPSCWLSVRAPWISSLRSLFR